MSVDVPFLNASVIEAEANCLLAEFGKAHGEIVAPPVPLDEIIELHLGLYSDFMDMSAAFGHGDIHGAIFFREKKIAVDLQFDPKLYPNKRGRYRFTLGHETGHWCLHRKHFLRRGRQNQRCEKRTQNSARIVATGSSKQPDLSHQSRLGRRGQDREIVHHKNWNASSAIHGFLPNHRCRDRQNRRRRRIHDAEVSRSKN